MQRLLIFLLLVTVAHAQTFWTRERKTETAIFLGAVAADGWASTRTNAPELNPLAKPFVNHGTGRQIAGSVLGIAAGILPSYFFHRAGHERLSRGWLRSVTSGEAVNSARMLYLYH